ncbi:MAG: antitoxin [Arenimonas sp. SCN 70-307]|uniref:type II TA system antitoxin MqsA family protein n=1 Tax=Arenimonas sp. SCN 70-307 TaxID=1660089 RepID=UPI00086C002F|nr:type II TA system antitoxin MqsA family protein [Arenimonas sp. SCN 70-307]ODS64966.1 MAG: antitoxin [Arenimonas sp. SCN 70-307]
MKCPSCGASTLLRDTRGLAHRYKGRTTQIPKVSGDWCPACGEVVLGLEEAKRVGAFVDTFNREVNASLVDPDFIAGVRRKLRLDQREAAALFGGGVNAFSRYETGKAKPPVALVKLLEVLDRHPELLEEIRTGR